MFLVVFFMVATQQHNNKFKDLTGPLFPIIIFGLLALLILSFSRLGLVSWQSERITDFSTFFIIIFQGLRVDIATISWLFILPAMLNFLMPSQGKIADVWRLVLRCWLVIGIWLIVYMELATPSFIQEYDLRPNRLFIEYLIYPKEVFSMLWVGYKLELFIGLTGSIITVLVGWKLSAFATSNLKFPKWYWRPVIAVCVVLIGVMGARSTLGHRPLNPAMVAFSTDPLINDMILNSSYSLVFALKNMASEKNAEDFYGKMDKEEVIQIVRDSTGRPQNFVNNDIPTLNLNDPTYKGKKKNLVILLQESLGARYVGGLGGLDLTPNLDQLLKEGWNFNHLYATGTRSVRGIEAVITGFTPTPSRAVVKLGKSQTGFFTLAQLLEKHGYHNQFIYGGESHFDNMKSFFLGNGFNEIVDQKDYDDSAFIGSWGASDEDLYEMAHQKFEQQAKSDQPFFSLVFTSSNHSPYEFPDGRIKLVDEIKQTNNNAVKYSDYALGEFFKKAKKSDYWENTVFIVIADHDARTRGSVPIPVDRFHIPGVIIGKGIQTKQDNRLVSSIDIPPTLLSLIGVQGETPMIGHDLTKPVPAKHQRALMQSSNNFAYMTVDKLAVLQPEKPPIGYSYSFNNTVLTPIALTDKEKATVQAHALWGGITYRKDLYKIPTINTSVDVFHTTKSMVEENTWSIH
jgi:phosphoglycerol transferase MdoB-like AlkP superfamily enzyme